MTGRYTPLHSSIWSDPDFIALTGNAQRVYMLAISQPNISYAGVVPFTEKRWAGMAADTTRGDICAAVNELEDANFVLLDEHTEELMARTFVEHNRIFKQPQLRKTLVRAFDAVLSPVLQAAFLAEQATEVVDYLVAHSPVAKSLVGRLVEACPKPATRLVEATPSGSGLQDLDLDLHQHTDPTPSPSPVDDGGLIEQACLALAEEQAERYGDIVDRHGWVKKRAQTISNERWHDALALIELEPDTTLSTLVAFLAGRRRPVARRSFSCARCEDKRWVENDDLDGDVTVACPDCAGMERNAS